MSEGDRMVPRRRRSIRFEPIRRPGGAGPDAAIPAAIGLLRAAVWLLLLSLVTALPATASIWEPVPAPPAGAYCTAFASGNVYLFAAWRDSADVPLGVYRMPIASPGAWEPLGFAGRPVHDILAGGPEDELVLVAAESDTCICRSVDAGLHWRAADVGLFDQSGYALAWNGHQPGILYAAAGDIAYSAVYRSSNLGDSWTQITGGATINYKPYLTAPRDGSGTVYYTFYGIVWESSVRRSTDHGGNWTELNPYPSPDASHDIGFLPADPVSGFVLVGASEIKRWNKTGELTEWTGIDETIGIEIADWARGVTFAAGKDAEGRMAAAWRAWDGASWTALSDGLPPDPGPAVGYDYVYYHLAAAPGRPRLYYASYKTGLWMLDVTDVTTRVPDPMLSRFDLAPVRPNPGNGVVTFRLEGPSAGSTDLRVFDSAGRCVYQDPAIAPGRSLIWDGRRFDGHPVPAGVYWVRASGAGHSAARSFVITR